jgi:hypothetical protein
MELIPLTQVPREIDKLTGRLLSYRRLYNLILDGRVPAEQDNARWQIRRADLPAIITQLGLTSTAAD